MAEFEVAVQETDDDEETLTFKIKDVDKDGKEIGVTEMTAHPPNPGQFAMLMASIGRGSKENDRISGLINFFLRVMDEEDAYYIEGRMFDGKDPMGLEHIEETMEWMVEQWSGRPTKPLCVSIRWPQSGGQNSTEPTPESTSSGSLLGDS